MSGTFELKELASQWLQFLQDGEVEACSVACAAFHTRVAEWVATNMCAEWLCPHAVEGRATLATFRQSLECLALMEFHDVCPAVPENATLAKGLLLCAEVCQ